MNFYNRHILPRLTRWVCSQDDITERRRKIVPRASGRVLEVGMGPGLNLPFFDPQKVDHVWGVEPSLQLRKNAEERAGQMPFTVDCMDASGEEIPLEKNSADTAIVTYALCSIPDVSKALQEINRILKPGGKFIFCEHGMAPDKAIYKWQNRLTPAWKKISGGCHLNRPISMLIQDAGFKIKTLDTGYTSSFKVLGFNYTGTAVLN